VNNNWKIIYTVRTESSYDSLFYRIVRIISEKVQVAEPLGHWQMWSAVTHWGSLRLSLSLSVTCKYTQTLSSYEQLKHLHQSTHHIQFPSATLGFAPAFLLNNTGKNKLSSYTSTSGSCPKPDECSPNSHTIFIWDLRSLKGLFRSIVCQRRVHKYQILW
jgi:hypothetical protein